MAKLGKINRNKLKEKKAKKAFLSRLELKKVIKDPSLSIEQRLSAQKQLMEKPRDASLTRVRNRCELTGRPRGVYRRFKLCRNKIRELASFGMLPGVIKASW